MDLVAKVMTTEPYASARTVYWVVDNGSSHNGQRSIDRMHEAWPTARLVHLPIHASWLNQIEIVFSIIQRKVIKPADFADLDALADRLCRFEDRYNETARPVRLAVHHRRPHGHARAGRHPDRTPSTRSPPDDRAAKMAADEGAAASRPRPASPPASTATPEPTGHSSPASMSASEPTSPTSTAVPATAPSSSCAGSATAAPPTSGASPSTGPATTTTRTPTSPPAPPSAPPKKHSTAPATSTSTPVTDAAGYTDELTRGTTSPKKRRAPGWRRRLLLRADSHPPQTSWG